MASMFLLGIWQFVPPKSSGQSHMYSVEPVAERHSPPLRHGYESQAFTTAAEVEKKKTIITNKVI